MDGAPIPLLRRQPSQERERRFTPAPERGQRFTDIVPEVLSLLGPSIRCFLRVEADELRFVAQVYEFAPRASFSREVLERCPTKLAAVRLSAVSWRDLGTSQRVIRTLGELGVRPGWLATLKETG